MCTPRYEFRLSRMAAAGGNGTPSGVPQPRLPFQLLAMVSPGILATLYVLGFLVVVRYLSQYGVASFSVLSLQYLVAGIWALAPVALLVLFMAASIAFQVYVNQHVTNAFWRIAIGGLLDGVLPIAIICAAAALLVSFGIGSSWRHGLEFVFQPGALFGVIGAMYLATILALLAWLARWPRIFKSVTGILSAFLFLFYVSQFAIQFYPKIPYSFGGGKPLQVTFILKRDGKASALIENGTSGRSVPYHLLVATEHTFVVLPPSNTALGGDQRLESIEFERDSVLGMMVLSDQK